jgi:hypothetical protein
MHMMTLKQQRAFMGAFDPYRSLSPAEVEGLYVERENGPFQSVFRSIAITPELGSLRIALVGSRGSGKSSELRRLAALLARDPDAEVVPLFLDIASELPPNASTAAWLPLVAAAVRAARVEWGEPVPAGAPAGLAELGITDAIFAKLVPAMSGAGAVVSLLSLGLGAVAAPSGLTEVVATAAAGLAAARAAAATLSEAVDLAQRSAPRGRALQPVMEGIREELRALEAASGRRPCLLLDGLDKRATVDEVFAALDDAALLHDLPCGVVLTGPVQLGNDPRIAAHDVPGRFRPVHLPTLRVVDRAGDDREEGQRALVSLFEKRWDAAQLGPPRFDHAQLLALARASSGIPRIFLSLVQGSFVFAQIRGAAAVGQPEVEAAVQEARLRMERTLDQASVAVLADVLEKGLPTAAEHSGLSMNNLVIAHANGEIWYRPNELLVPFVRHWVEAERRRAAEAAREG